jgi:hypothetical protein
MAFVGIYWENPFGLKREVIMLWLLAFLSIDALVERHTLLTNMEKDIELLTKSIKLKLCGRDFLKHRKEFPRLEQLVSDANKEIIVTGIALDSIARIIGVFKSKAKEGCNIKFLSISPKDNITNETANYFKEDSSALMSRLNINLDLIYKELVISYPDQVEIRTTDFRPAFGYFIVDSLLDKGYMTVESYIPVADSVNRPFFILTKTMDDVWFEIYLNHFNQLWDRSNVWDKKEY